jgi:hypothetical protein
MVDVTISSDYGREAQHTGSLIWNALPLLSGLPVSRQVLRSISEVWCSYQHRATTGAWGERLHPL